MSRSRISRPFDRKLTSRRSASDRKAPETLSKIFSWPVSRAPAGLTAFWALQRRDQRRPVDAEAGEFLRRELDKDLLVLRAEELDLRHVRNLKQARADVLDIVAQLAMGEAVGGEAVDQAEGVAEVVVEARPDHAGRQRAADVADVLAHLVPDVRHFGGLGRALEVDEDRRPAGDRVAAQEIEALASPATLRSIRSVTCCSVSSMVAPGHPAWTIMVRKVKGGSSSRPRLKNEAMPASVTAIMMKTMKERCFSAQSERLSPTHEAAPRSRTFWPGCSAWTPAVTTMSPGSSPCEITADGRIEPLHFDIAQRDREVLRDRRPTPPAADRSRSARSPESRCRLRPRAAGAPSPSRRAAWPRDDRSG